MPTPIDPKLLASLQEQLLAGAWAQGYTIECATYSVVPPTADRQGQIQIRTVVTPTMLALTNRLHVKPQGTSHAGHSQRFPRTQFTWTDRVVHETLLGTNTSGTVEGQTYSLFDTAMDWLNADPILRIGALYQPHILIPPSTRLQPALDLFFRHPATKTFLNSKYVIGAYRTEHLLPLQDYFRRHGRVPTLEEFANDPTVGRQDPPAPFYRAPTLPRVLEGLQAEMGRLTDAAFVEMGLPAPGPPRHHDHVLTRPTALDEADAVARTFGAHPGLLVDDGRGGVEGMWDLDGPALVRALAGNGPFNYTKEVELGTNRSLQAPDRTVGYKEGLAAVRLYSPLGMLVSSLEQAIDAAHILVNCPQIRPPTLNQSRLINDLRNSRILRKVRPRAGALARIVAATEPYIGGNDRATLRDLLVSHAAASLAAAGLNRLADQVRGLATYAKYIVESYEPVILTGAPPPKAPVRSNTKRQATGIKTDFRL